MKHILHWNKLACQAVSAVFIGGGYNHNHYIQSFGEHSVYFL